MGVAADARGHVYVADAESHTIRVVYVPGLPAGANSGSSFSQNDELMDV